MADQADLPGEDITEGLRAELAALDEIDVKALTGDERHAAVVELQRFRSVYEATAARFTRAWDERRDWASDGSRSPRARLARDAHCSVTSAGRAVGLAAKLEAMPLVAAALAEGKINVDHAWRLGVARTGHRASAFRIAEETLVAIAVEEADFEEFLRAVQYWEQGADDQIGASDEQHRRHRAGRKAHHSRTFQGTWKLDATFDPVDGEILDTALGRIYHDLLMAEWAEIRAEHGDAATADLLPRTNQQRRADALVEMARRSMAVAPGARMPRPLITVLVDYEQLEGPIRETFNGSVLTTHQVADLLSEADVERAVYAPRNRIIELSRTERFFRGGLRRAIEIRDRHCTHPGCRVPAERCHVDHITEACDGGITEQGNGRLHCPCHNRQRPGRRKAPPPSDDPDDPDARSPYATDDDPTRET